jgi:ligand-binding SRPBCC domain-containing protein
MLQFDFRQVIARPITEVFEYSSDPQNILASDPTADVVTTNRTLRKGSDFEISFDKGRKNAKVMILEYDQPNLYEFEAHIKMPMAYVMKGSYTFAERDGKTEMCADVMISDIPSAMEIILKEQIRKLLQENFEATKSALESKDQ